MSYLRRMETVSTALEVRKFCFIYIYIFLLRESKQRQEPKLCGIAICSSILRDRLLSGGRHDGGRWQRVVLTGALPRHRDGPGLDERWLAGKDGYWLQSVLRACLRVCLRDNLRVCLHVNLSVHIHAHIYDHETPF